MTKFFTIFACLLLACSYSTCDASFSSSRFSSNDDKSKSIPSSAPAPASTPDCDSTIDDVMSCISFLYSDDSSKPDAGCCAGFIAAASTNMRCLCAIINSHELKPQRSKAITIPSGCGIKSPLGQCGESQVSKPAPPKASCRSHAPYLKPEPIKSPVSPPSSVPSVKPVPSETPAAPSPSVASTAPAPAPKKALAAPAAYPISISLIAISSIFFVYFF
ncbi:hypothetical protein TanjilG_04989 [Lupinus angustifolius]|uniref:Bifunctional inhibitor/plant lipid transfer protein/seed storage helical domain-containing protein n=1 Tax=Lupinus angustifolius TaxID=3871 RepID=A0A4P1R4V0_LUPAN|nr:PREDICTED: non-specific lipid-transfer protein-like protein At5g64080 [Lupinus angustifolius]OIW02396.1 hypothetical protein TanjilG_04989 [Lupinus angustifolius]